MKTIINRKEVTLICAGIFVGILTSFIIFMVIVDNSIIKILNNPNVFFEKRVTLGKTEEGKPALCGKDNIAHAPFGSGLSIMTKTVPSDNGLKNMIPLKCISKNNKE